jgi:hypothetical protein
VVKSDRPIAREVLAIRQRYGDFARRLRQRLLGGISVDEVYIHSIPVHAGT